MDYRKKNQIRKTRQSTPVLVLLIVLFVLIGRATWNLFAKYNDVRTADIEARAELSKLSAQEDAMRERVNFLQTDRGRETEIRGKFMVARDGEGVIMVVDPKVSATTTTPKPPESAWDRFLNIFR